MANNFSTVQQNYTLGFQYGVKLWQHFFRAKDVPDDPNIKVIHANNHSSCISDLNVHWICNYSKCWHNNFGSL